MPSRSKSRSKPAKSPSSSGDIRGVKTTHFNPLHPKHSTAVAEVKKNVAIGKRAILRDVHPFHADLAKRIPRAEVERHLAFISRIIPTTSPAGSYRRGATSSADIDIIVREPIADTVAKLNATGYIHHTFGVGDKKFSGIVRLPGARTYRHLDIVFTTPRCYPFAMLYFTGPARFNILMRIKAKRRGLKLNEYGLWRENGTLIPGLVTERDIFAALNVPYKDPRERV